MIGENGRISKVVIFSQEKIKQVNLLLKKDVVLFVIKYSYDQK
jgi:hypothetical protein